MGRHLGALGSALFIYASAVGLAGGMKRQADDDVMTRRCRTSLLEAETVLIDIDAASLAAMAPQ